MRLLFLFLALSSAVAADELTVLDPASEPADAFENWLIREFNTLCDKRSSGDLAASVSTESASLTNKKFADWQAV